MSGAVAWTGEKVVAPDLAQVGVEDGGLPAGTEHTGLPGNVAKQLGLRPRFACAASSFALRSTRALGPGAEG